MNLPPNGEKNPSSQTNTQHDGTDHMYPGNQRRAPASGPKIRRNPDGSDSHYFPGSLGNGQLDPLVAHAGR